MPTTAACILILKTPRPGCLSVWAKFQARTCRKIQSFEAGTDTIKPEAIQPTPHFCLIDGEHTDVAVLRDARFCLSVVEPDGCIAFHDANLIYGALDTFIKELSKADDLSALMCCRRRFL